jgi:hypothetical protein
MGHSSWLGQASINTEQATHKRIIAGGHKERSSAISNLNVIPDLRGPLGRNPLQIAVIAKLKAAEAGWNGCRPTPA